MVLTEGPALSRLFIYLTGSYLHRIEKERREPYGGDLDLALVHEIIGAAGVEAGMRDAAYREKYQNFVGSIPVAEQHSVSASSIARASGIPRETVRRKLRKLQEMKVIVEKERARYVLRPGVYFEGEQQASFARAIDQTLRFINTLAEHGLIRWVPAAKGKSGTRSH